MHNRVNNALTLVKANIALAWEPWTLQSAHHSETIASNRALLSIALPASPLASVNTILAQEFFCPRGVTDIVTNAHSNAMPTMAILCHLSASIIVEVNTITV